MEDFAPYICQIVEAAIATGVGWLAATLYYENDPYLKRWNQERQTLLGIGVFGVLAGIVLAVIAPAILSGVWWTVFFITAGASAFSMLGVGSLLSSQFDDAGLAFGYLFFSFIYGPISNFTSDVWGISSIIPRLVILAALLATAFFLGSYVMWADGRPHQSTHKTKRNIFATITAILSIIEFFNILYGFWENLTG